MTPARVNALVLAAGRSTRMGGPNKLTAIFDGKSLIRRTVDVAAASRAARVFVVLGHQAETLRAQLSGSAAKIVDNAAFADGLSTSLTLGFDLAREGVDGVLVVLADQPSLTAAHLDALIEAFGLGGGAAAIVATDGGEWGNPVILPAAFGPRLSAITGDRGARALLRADAVVVREVEIGAAALQDVDTPEAMSAAGGIFPPDAPPRRS